MTPTAPASPATNPSHPMRRHIGQSFGRFNDQRIRDRDRSLRTTPDGMAKPGTSPAGDGHRV